MRGTPYYYYGDELGMSNIKFDNIEDYRDIATLNKYKKLKSDGGDLDKYIEMQKRASRDNGRTPLQWDDSPNAGFTSDKPWIKVNPNYTTVNAAAQEKDSNSVLNYFRKMVKLRKENEVLIYGLYTLLDKDNPDVYAYTRELNGKKFLVLLNFKSKAATANTTGIDLSKAKILIGNYASPPANGRLQPYESVIYEL
jgi:oligo-1,6-glucosidase